MHLVQLHLDRVTPGDRFLQYVGFAAQSITWLKGCTRPVESVLFGSLPHEAALHGSAMPPELKAYDKTPELLQQIRPEAAAVTRDGVCDMVGVLHRRHVEEAAGKSVLGKTADLWRSTCVKQFTNTDTFETKAIGMALKCPWASGM